MWLGPAPWRMPTISIGSKEQLLTVPEGTPFDVLDPIRSYAQLFN